MCRLVYVLYPEFLHLKAHCETKSVSRYKRGASRSKLTLMGTPLKRWGSTSERHTSRASVVVDIAESGGMVCGGRRRSFIRHAHPGVAINTSGTLCGPPDCLKGSNGHVTTRPRHGRGPWEARGVKARRRTGRADISEEGHPQVRSHSGWRRCRRRCGRY